MEILEISNSLLERRVYRISCKRLLGFTSLTID